MDDKDFFLRMMMELFILILVGVFFWGWWIVGIVVIVEVGGWGVGVDENFIYFFCVVWLEYKIRIFIIEYFSIFMYMFVNVLN